MRPNVEFRIELPKTNLGLAESYLQQKTRGYVQKWPPTPTSKGYGPTRYNKRKSDIVIPYECGQSKIQGKKTLI